MKNEAKKGRRNKRLITLSSRISRKNKRARIRYLKGSTLLQMRDGGRRKKTQKRGK